MFSVGVLYSSQEFLDFIDSTPNLDFACLNTSKNFSVASLKSILKVCNECDWIKLNILGFIELTERGRHIVNVKKSEDKLRLQIGHLIETYSPPWLPLLTRGRSESKQYLPNDVLQCLREAGLFDAISDEIIEWWDKFSQMARHSQKDSKIEVGRFGEKLSINHERERTKREPIWQGFESNLCGYDILSCLSENDSTYLHIEVKTSNSTFNVASLHITRNEWEVATTSNHFIFHLWSLQPKPELNIINTEQMSKHIPIDYGGGSWESVLISFSNLRNI